MNPEHIHTTNYENNIPQPLNNQPSAPPEMLNIDILPYQPSIHLDSQNVEPVLSQTTQFVHQVNYPNQIPIVSQETPNQMSHQMPLEPVQSYPLQQMVMSSNHVPPIPGQRVVYVNAQIPVETNVPVITQNIPKQGIGGIDIAHIFGSLCFILGLIGCCIWVVILFSGVILSKFLVIPFESDFDDAFGKLLSVFVLTTIYMFFWSLTCITGCINIFKSKVKRGLTIMYLLFIFISMIVFVSAHGIQLSLSLSAFITQFVIGMLGMTCCTLIGCYQAKIAFKKNPVLQNTIQTTQMQKMTV